jgi:hypothetical protein
MRLIAGNVLGHRNAQHRKVHVIWFNAWQYEHDQTAIWRTLLLRVLEGLKELELTPEDAAASRIGKRSSTQMCSARRKAL